MKEEQHILMIVQNRIAAKRKRRYVKLYFIYRLCYFGCENTCHNIYSLW